MKSPSPMTIGPAANWVTILAAVFGAITLLGLFAFAFLAGSLKPDFICNSFTLLAAVFSLGVALSAGFIGGAATLTSTMSEPLKRIGLAFSAGGGIAVLFFAFFAFQHFQPDTCTLSQKLSAANAEIANLKQKAETLKTIKIVIPSNSFHNLPPENVVIQYTDQVGDTKSANRVGSSYEISVGDLLISGGEIFVSYRLDTIPAERAKRPTRIPIDQFTYSTDPLQIRLWLVEPN